MKYRHEMGHEMWHNMKYDNEFWNVNISFPKFTSFLVNPEK